MKVDLGFRSVTETARLRVWSSVTAHVISLAYADLQAHE